MTVLAINGLPQYQEHLTAATLKTAGDGSN
jgi:hypothetical protein